MNRFGQRWFALAAAVAFVSAACGEDPASGKTDGGEDPKPQSALILTRIGPGALTAHPGDRLSLQALLSQSDVRFVPDAPVTWKIAADEAGDSALEFPANSTDATGVASNELTLNSVGEVVVKAESPGAVSKNAVWKIDVVPIVKRLRIVESTEVINTDAAGTKAAVTTFVNKQTSLRVRVSAEGGEGERPVAGETVTFSFFSTIAGASFPANPSGVTQTLGDGEANIVLGAGTTTGSYTVLASLQTGLTATFDVTVGRDGPTGGCTSTAQCPSGKVCMQGSCRDPSIGGGSCGGGDKPCPFGYTCNPTSGMCEPGFGSGCDACPEGTHCDTALDECVTDNPECGDAVPCPSGFDCVNGICTPADGTIDVTGHWYTKHSFNVAAALPGWVRTTGAAIRIIDQTLQGQLNLPGWVNALIAGLLRQYIPEWVYAVAEILDTMFTVFSHLRAEGEMDLVSNGSPSIIAGQEYWTSFIFYVLSQCNGQIGGNPYQPPPCARVDVYTSELEGVDLAVDVKPFAAKVGGSNGTYTLIVDKRQVKMKFAGLLKYMLDMSIQIATGYPSLEDKPCCQNGQTPGPRCAEQPECGLGSGALSHLIDCEGVAQLVGDVIPIDVTTLCELAVSAAGQAAANALRNVVVSDDVLEFQGQATARPLQSRPTYAEDLGFDGVFNVNNRGDFTVTPGDGNWDGKFKIGIGVNGVPGRWRASRNPLPTQ